MIPSIAHDPIHQDPRRAVRAGATASNGGRLVTTDGRALPLLSATLAVDARGGLARVTLEQVFGNPHDEPLSVTYTLGLPADAAVSGFAFRIGDQRVVGEVDRRSAARERFEQAIVEGHSAALLEQDRSSVFRQEVGNIPAKTEVVVEIVLDQRLHWLGALAGRAGSDGAWEWRFPTVVAPRYLGAEGQTPDADRVTVDVAEDIEPGQAPRMGLRLVVRDPLIEGGRPTSPSHPLAISHTHGHAQIGFGDEAGAGLDRDVVVRWPVAAPHVGVSVDMGRPATDRAHANRAYGLLTIVPPTAAAALDPVARDLIVLIDTSGSMGGRPLEQAQRVVAAMIDTLGERDRIELIEFSNRANRFRARPLAANAKNRAAAQAWLAALRAGGATEMQSGIYEALRPLRGDAQRQILLITDGMIGFEERIVDTIVRELPRGSRLHTLGVGSAVNQALIGPAARAGRGTQATLGLDEDVEPVAQRMVAATTAPLLVDVEIVGEPVRDLAPARLPDLYAGRPALVGVALDPAGGEVTVRGRTASGSWTRTITIPATEAATGGPSGGPATALYGREHVEDLEMRRASGHESAGLDAEIERVGLEFQISTRLTSWVAVSDQQTVDPRDPSRRETMPQALPYGMSAQGLGLRAAAMPVSAAAPGFAGVPMMARMMAPPPPAASAAPMPPPQGAPRRRRVSSPKQTSSLADTVRSFFGRGADDESAFDGPTSETGMTATGLPLILHGKLVHRAGDIAVIETELALSLAWEPPATIVVVDAEGNEHEVELEVSKTTRAGRLTAGQILRITLRLPASITAVGRVRVEVDGGFEIQIEHG